MRRVAKALACFSGPLPFFIEARQPALVELSGPAGTILVFRDRFMDHYENEKGGRGRQQPHRGDSLASRREPSQDRRRDSDRQTDVANRDISALQPGVLCAARIESGRVLGARACRLRLHASIVTHTGPAPYTESFMPAELVCFESRCRARYA